MANETMFMSAQGLEFLREEEAEIDGLYDDRSGYCTFGIGHLVHAREKWSCFLLTAASGDELWKTLVAKKWPGTKFEVPYLQRAAAFKEKFADLKALAVENAKSRIAQKKYSKEFAKLSKADQEKVTELAKTAVEEQATMLAMTVKDVLKEDVKKFERAVRDKVKIALTQDEFDALVSFSFNVGADGFGGSSVLKEINKGHFNSGDAKQRAASIKTIEDAFAKWNKSGGVVVKGLVKRRKHESDLFLKAARAALTELQKTAGPAKAVVGPR